MYSAKNKGSKRSQNTKEIDASKAVLKKKKETKRGWVRVCHGHCISSND